MLIISTFVLLKVSESFNSSVVEHQRVFKHTIIIKGKTRNSKTMCYINLILPW